MLRALDVFGGGADQSFCLGKIIVEPLWGAHPSPDPVPR